MASVASMPVISGMAMSMRTMSQSSSRTISMAILPFSALPMVTLGISVRSVSSATMTLNGLSSAIRMRSGGRDVCSGATSFLRSFWSRKISFLSWSAWKGFGTKPSMPWRM